MMTVSTSGARHLLFRLAGPLQLPEGMLAVLRDEVVLAGWMRSSGILADVSVRSAPGADARRIDGPVRVVILEGSVGLAAGDVSCGLRVVVTHANEAGVIETIAGDLLEARVVALEVHVLAFDDVVATRQLDPSGVWLLDATSSTAPAAPQAAPPAPLPAPPSPPPNNASFGATVRANDTQVQVQQSPPAPAPPVARPSPTFSSHSNAMPSRIAKPVAAEEEEQAVPEPGDIVEHFAFGRCEVVKTDGDRLHVRLPKDQRVKEIALEMLKVSLIPAVEGEATKHYRLARKL